MVILESTRRSGKSYTCEKVEQYFSNIRIYKDFGLRILNKINTKIDIDDYCIGRDLAYAQFIPTLPFEVENNLLLDRQYISTCVYGLYYRSKYNKQFWVKHLQRVEELYKNIGTKVIILFIELTNKDFQRISSMGRKKDWLEEDGEQGYRNQYELYEFFLKETSFHIIRMKAFQDDEYIISKISEAFNF